MANLGWLGGSVWFGGPLLASLAVHAAIGVCTGLLASRAVSEIAVALASIERTVAGGVCSHHRSAVGRPHSTPPPTSQAFAA